MKRTLKLAAMLLCVVAFTAFTACSKDEDVSNVDEITGKWECIESSYSNPNLPIPDNAYAGVIWEFRDAEKDEDGWYIHGKFDVKVGNASYNDGKFDYYVDEFNSNHKVLEVYANTDTDDEKFYVFHGSHVMSYWFSVLYDKVSFSGNEMTLIQTNFNGETIIRLKFRKI